MSATGSHDSATTANRSETTKPRLMIVIASVREGRVGLSVGRWFEAEARASEAFDVDLVDLAELDLPLMTEPNHPRLQRYTFDYTKAWSTRVEAADAFVFVMPEYNFTYTAPLKNAIDYLSKEWANKPLGFLTYGGVSGGTRAMVGLLPALQALRIHPVQPAVNVPFVTQFVNDDGEFEPNEVTSKATAGMLEALAQAAPLYARLRSKG